MQNQNELLYQKLDDWIDVLDNQILELHEHQYLFKEFQKISAQNPLLQGNAFTEAIVLWYSSYMSIVVRKLVDKHKDAISYRNLLERIKKNPKVISRVVFLKKWVDGNYNVYLANTDFDKYAGVGNEYIDLKIIDNQIAELEVRTKKITNFVDKRIAHRDSVTFEEVPTFTELYEAIEFLGKLHQRYFAVFKCSSTHLTPSIVYNWKEIFYKSWISE